MLFKQIISFVSSRGSIAYAALGITLLLGNSGTDADTSQAQTAIRDALLNGSGEFDTTNSHSIPGRELNASTTTEGRQVGHRSASAYEGTDPMSRPTGRISPQMNYLPTQSTTSSSSSSSSSGTTSGTEATFPMITRTAIWSVANPERDTDGYSLKYTDTTANSSIDSNSTGTTKGKTVKYGSTEYKSRTMQSMNLSTDDDIFKSQMFYFQAITDMEKAHMGASGSKTGELDNFLNVSNTAFGVGNIALGFLDKAVSSSMGSSQMMADINIMAHLLKQISYQTYLTNHPNRGSIFEMADEKFEKCMFETQGKSVPTGFSLDHVDISDCTDCGDKDKRAPYEYCSCCADKSLKVSKSTSGSSSSGSTSSSGRLSKRLCDSYLDELKKQGGNAEGYVADFTYSLVEKAFLGVKADVTALSISGLSSGTGSNDPKTLIQQFAYNFQDLYGDYCFYQSSDSGAIKMRYVYPLYSVQQQILFMRNGGEANKMIGSSSSSSGSLAYCSTGVGIIDHCPKDSSGTVPGICPTLRAFLELVRDNQYESARKDHPETIDAYWKIASLGQPITVSDLVNIKQLGDPPHYISPYQDRFVETYCDSAATTAFKRVHSRMNSITQDYMSINTRLTDQEKRLVLSLMTRPTEQLNLALRESQSNLELTIGAAQEAARKNEAKRGSIMASSRALYSLVQQSSEIKDFGR